MNNKNTKDIVYNTPSSCSRCGNTPTRKMVVKDDFLSLRFRYYVCEECYVVYNNTFHKDKTTTIKSHRPINKGEIAVHEIAQGKRKARGYIGGQK